MRSIVHRPEHVFSVGPNYEKLPTMDTSRDTIIVPSTNKEVPKEGIKDHVYMEDDDNKLHIPIPTRAGAFQKKPETTSAFRSASNSHGGKLDNFPPNTQLLNVASNIAQHSFSTVKRDPDTLGGLPSSLKGQGETSRALPLQIELNLSADDVPEKHQHEDIPVPIKMEEDDDDDEDLFGDDSGKSSVKARVNRTKESESVLDKRGETDKSDDEDLFVA